MDASKLEGQWCSLAERFRRIAGNDCCEGEVKATAAVCGRILPRMRDAGLIPTNLILEPSAAELQEHAGQPDAIAHLWTVCWERFVIAISHPRINPDFPIPNPLAFHSEYRGGPEQLTAGSTATADWRIRAETGAAICDALAAAAMETMGQGGEAADDPPVVDGAGQPSLEARALAMLTDHPDWTNARIAAALQCNRASLYRLTKFKAARQLLRRDGIASADRGSKADGRIEAWKSNE